MVSNAQLGITYDASGWLSNYGRFAYGPNIIVVHSLECDPKPHIAEQLSAPGGWLDNEGLAPQRMTDPVSIVRAIPDGCQGGHIGGPGNSHCAGVEVSGRAAYTRAQWMDGGAAQQGLEHQAKAVAGLAVIYGWAKSDLRWLSIAQLRAGTPRGICTHNDISVSGISGTNHWDPGVGYPFAWFLGRVQVYYDQIKGITPPPPKKDWFDMASQADLEKAVDKVVRALVPGLVHGELEKAFPWWLARGLNVIADGKGNAAFNEKSDLVSTALGTGGTKAVKAGVTDVRNVLGDARTDQAANAKVLTAIRAEAAVAARAAVVVQARIEGMLNTLTNTPPVVTTRPTSHTLTAGQTLTAVAGLYGLTLAQLLAANPGVKNPDTVDVGTVLVIPPKP